MPQMIRRLAALISLNLAISCPTTSLRAAEPAKPHPYRLPSVSIKVPVIWGSTCEAPDGTALSFGGEDRDAEDGLAHTRLRVNGEWIDLREQLNAPSAFKSAEDRIWSLRNSQKDLLTRARHLYFEGDELSRASIAKAENDIAGNIQSIISDLQRLAKRESELSSAYANARELGHAREKALEVAKASDQSAAAMLREMRAVQVLLEQAADHFATEPPARALSPIIYEPKSKCFVLFGGDHFDYLTADTWVFDPAARRWSVRYPETAPPPRANHRWNATSDGKLTLTGGYTYFSNTDYMGGQYIDINDGDWTYDMAANTWTGSGKSQSPDDRTYRTGPFLPEFFFDAAKPDAAEFQTTLKNLPANVWTRTHPPKLPKVNRDWGSAIIDPDRDLILRWSGGHCAHGGTDVLQYHLATNRWELCYPVEFPLGQLYDNIEYPGGYNFNHRPWISGHTYQNYGIDPVLKKMIFLGHAPFGYVYDPDAGDWTTRHRLPKAMNYSGSMYTLTTTPTPAGLICWTNPNADILRFDAAANEWKPLHLSGEALPGSEVDNSTVVYDSRRDRLIFFRKGYGNDKKYNGEIYALDLKSLAVSRLSPVGKESAAAIPYLCQIRYDAKHDMLLVGATLQPDTDGIRRTPAYDCATNSWITLKITGSDPSGKEGRNVSLGMMYDARRELFWAVDTNSEVYVLRLDPSSADAKPMQVN